ncbi:substrate-binding periplasmic protein [Stutzerimonas chloritidismutans]|uniref:substrate-binding periplasmic protein n=1 Tax=Stutzerimonas chloritidismutans TaxID=203192 RepID=UPI003F17E615
MHRLALLLALGLLPLLGIAQQRVEVWTYHLSPPFLLKDEQGLSHAFVDLLNNDPANAGRFRFELIELPRKRIDARLAKGRPGLLLWATPEFFTEAQTARASWSEPLLVDRQEFVSLPDTAFEYEGIESLQGKTVGGVLGHRYAGLEDAVANGSVRRQDVRSDLQNIEKLLNGRIHTLLIPRSSLLHYRKQHDLGRLHVSARPLYEFSRHLLMTDSLSSSVKEYLSWFVNALPSNPEWQILVFHYGLDPMAVTE